MLLLLLQVKPVKTIYDNYSPQAQRISANIPRDECFSLIFRGEYQELQNKENTETTNTNLTCMGVNKFNSS